ncbi:MAG: TrkH family potassium uptake protein [Xanthomonadales bacterium]|nr:TrkH family potassium uptake protein [Xanthomonadales bacterium]
MRARALVRLLGALAGMSSLMLLPALLIAAWERDRTLPVFGWGFVAMAAGGFALWWLARGARYELRLRDGFLVTAAAWILVAILAALPLWLAMPGLGLTRAVFEATSGITTTGATVMTAIDALPASLRFYRQTLNFVGGMGIVVLAVAVLPMLRVGGMQLMGAERAAAPSREGKFTPRIAETAKALWSIYLVLTAACALAYWAAGMSLFDAIGHSFSTIATAGFSTRDASIGHFDSPAIEAVAIVFMLVGSVNFALHYRAWHRASNAHYYADPEIRVLLAVALAVSALVTVALWLEGLYPDRMTALRHAVFHTVSHLTTTGYATTDFHNWPAALAFLMILVAFVGGCAGSTAGGLKVIRIIVLVRQGLLELTRAIHPKAQLLLKVGNATVPILVSSAVLAYFTLFIASLALFTLLLAACGLDLVTAASAAASCLLNLGPALGAAAPSYAALPESALWLLSLAMLLGRLEFFTLLVLLTPAFWRS